MSLIALVYMGSSGSRRVQTGVLSLCAPSIWTMWSSTCFGCLAMIAAFAICSSNGNILPSDDGRSDVVSATNQSILFDSSNESVAKGNQIKSRRKRYVAFPEGSSFSVCFAIVCTLLISVVLD